MEFVYARTEHFVIRKKNATLTEKTARLHRVHFATALSSPMITEFGPRASGGRAGGARPPSRLPTLPLSSAEISTFSRPSPPPTRLRVSSIIGMTLPRRVSAAKFAEFSRAALGHDHRTNLDRNGVAERLSCQRLSGDQRGSARSDHACADARPSEFASPPRWQPSIFERGRPCAFRYTKTRSPRSSTRARASTRRPTSTGPYAFRYTKMRVTRAATCPRRDELLGDDRG